MNKYRVTVIDKNLDYNWGKADTHCQVCKNNFVLYGTSPYCYIIYNVVTIPDKGMYGSMFDVYTCSEECANMYILSKI